VANPLDVPPQVQIQYVCDTYEVFQMQKKLTITLDERVYEGLHETIGRGNISQFIESLVRPHVVTDDLDAAYREMAADEEREAEAFEWVEGLVGDVADETW